MFLYEAHVLITCIHMYIYVKYIFEFIHIAQIMFIFGHLIISKILLYFNHSNNRNKVQGIVAMEINPYFTLLFIDEEGFDNFMVNYKNKLFYTSHDKSFMFYHHGLYK